MADIKDQASRSRNMSAIRGADTKPEMMVRRGLHALGLRFRLHGRDLPGRPDLVLPKHRAVVFVHGCFWHRHPDCRYATTPATRPEFWEAKFASNVTRDAKARSDLLAAGWRVATVWECCVMTRASSRCAVTELADWIRGSGCHLTLPEDMN